MPEKSKERIDWEAEVRSYGEVHVVHWTCDLCFESFLARLKEADPSVSAEQTEKKYYFRKRNKPEVNECHYCCEENYAQLRVPEKITPENVRLFKSCCSDFIKELDAIEALEKERQEKGAPKHEHLLCSICGNALRIYLRHKEIGDLDVEKLTSRELDKLCCSCGAVLAEKETRKKVGAFRVKKVSGVVAEGVLNGYCTACLSADPAILEPEVQ